MTCLFQILSHVGSKVLLLLRTSHAYVGLNSPLSKPYLDEADFLHHVVAHLRVYARMIY